MGAVPFSALRSSSSQNARLHPSSRLAMPAPQPGADVPERLRCAGCGDVIGVYEPLVVSSGGSVRTTSCAAEPDLWGYGGTHYHCDCYAEV